LDVIVVRLRERMAQAWHQEKDSRTRSNA